MQAGHVPGAGPVLTFGRVDCHGDTAMPRRLILLAAALTAALNSSVPVDTSTWPPSCPTNSGAVYTETFSYNNQAPVMATTSLDGCAMTSVGTRAVWTSAATLGILAGILGDKPSANSVLLGPQPCQQANPNTRYCRGPSDRLVPRWH